MGLEPRQRASDERGDGRCALVLEQLDVRQSGMVVDDRVRVVVADPRSVGHPVAAALRAIASDAMPRTLKPRITGCVHVQQVPRARPLVAARLFPIPTRGTRDPVAVQDLPDSGVRVSSFASDKPWPPSGSLTRFAD